MRDEFLNTPEKSRNIFRRLNEAKGAKYVKNPTQDKLLDKDGRQLKRRVSQAGLTEFTPITGTTPKKSRPQLRVPSPSKSPPRSAWRSPSKKQKDTAIKTSGWIELKKSSLKQLSKKRDISQQKVLQREGFPLTSADNYVKNFLILPELPSAKTEKKKRKTSGKKRKKKKIIYEILHLVAFCLLGKKAQNADNFVAGTVEANTQMIAVEKLVQHLIDTYERIYICVTAELMKCQDKVTHIANKISYKIKIPTFDAKNNPITIELTEYTFDAHDRTAPNVRFPRALRDHAMKEIEEKLEKANSVYQTTKKRKALFNATDSPKLKRH